MKLKTTPLEVAAPRSSGLATKSRARLLTGFTLIEIMVAMSLFAIVAVIVSGALITVSDVNRKAQAIKLAMDNVAFAMDSMVFNLREGGNYGCASLGSSGTPCSPGDPIVFESTRAGSKRYIGYRLNEVGSIQFSSANTIGGLQGGYKDITSSEVDITNLRFFIPLVQGTQLVPRVTLLIEGQVPGKTQTNFYLQTTVKKI